GDVCVSRRKFGRHLVFPLHSDISVSCRKIGFDNLNPIIWHKISNACFEVENGTKFLGKPYEPNAIIKNDIEFILMQRKPRGYRQPTERQRDLSKIKKNEFNTWFRQIWTIPGASTKNHPAPFPFELASRLIKMFSFVGDTVLDPFCGTGGILIEAGIIGAKVVGMDIDEKMVEGTRKNLKYCNIKDYEVFKGDARNITLPYKVDAIVTDPPYGISASTAGLESKKIYMESLLSMHGILKEDGYICMATPHYLDIHEIVDDTKFKIIEQYDIRMHKSLTRVISVLKKN
ncbi:MAG: DNA methyltransferase, partial [Methanobacterium sp.]